ncbi:hypothetical protein [Amycolatopsis anabasis]|uniref:hypothetical protein n=1 Tax=Amycolatopsis anabasis TaxID=1840409 RepID=UPI00131D2FA2|nr:hypothetical protein [Amycolatopsis anabasis]
MPVNHSEPHPQSRRERPRHVHRAVHFVGSLPAQLTPNDRSTMQWILDHSYPAALTALPCDPDPRSITDFLNGFASTPAWELAKRGDSTDYHDLPVHRIAARHQLTAGDLALGRPSHVAALMDARLQLDTHDLRLPAAQVSIPNALDLALATYGDPATALPRLPRLQDAIGAEITEISRQWRDEVVLQLESPVTLTTLEKAPRQRWETLARGLAYQLAGMISQAPADTRWIVHLRYGDPARTHTPLFTPQDLVAPVLVCNALSARLRKLRYPMPPVHIPISHGHAPPSQEPHFYAALRHLRRDINVIAGVVDEAHPDQSRHALRLVEATLDRTAYAVAATCGLSHRTPAAATDNAALAVTLAAMDYDEDRTR